MSWSDTFAACVAVVLADDSVDTVIAVGVPTGVGDPLSAVARKPGWLKPLLMVQPGQLESVTAHHGVPCYGEVGEAARVAAKLAARARWLSEGEGVVPELPGIDLTTAARLVDDYFGRHSNGGWMSRKDSGDLLRLGLGGPDKVLLDDRVTASASSARRVSRWTGKPFATFCCVPDVVDVDLDPVLASSGGGLCGTDCRGPEGTIDSPGPGSHSFLC